MAAIAAGPPVHTTTLWISTDLQLRWLLLLLLLLLLFHRAGSPDGQANLPTFNYWRRWIPKGFSSSCPVVFIDQNKLPCEHKSVSVIVGEKQCWWCFDRWPNLNIDVLMFWVLKCWSSVGTQKLFRNFSYFWMYKINLLLCLKAPIRYFYPAPIFFYPSSHILHLQPKVKVVLPP